MVSGGTPFHLRLQLFFVIPHTRSLGHDREWVSLTTEGRFGAFCDLKAGRGIRPSAVCLEVHPNLYCHAKSSLKLANTRGIYVTHLLSAGGWPLCDFDVSRVA